MAPLSALHTQIEESNGIYSRCLYGQLLAPQTSFKSNLNAHYGFKQQRKLIELPFFNRTHLHTHIHRAISFRTHTASHSPIRRHSAKPQPQPIRHLNKYTHTHKRGGGGQKGAWPLSLSYNKKNNNGVTSITLLISLGKSFAQMKIKGKEQYQNKEKAVDKRGKAKSATKRRQNTNKNKKPLFK